MIEVIKKIMNMAILDIALFTIFIISYLFHIHI